MKTLKFLSSAALLFILSMCFTFAQDSNTLKQGMKYPSGTNSNLPQDSKTAKKEYNNASKSLKDKDYPNAIKSFTKSIEADAKYFEAYVGRAEAYESVKEWAKAVQDYRSAIPLLDKSDKQLKDLYFRCGSGLLIMQKYEDASEMFDKTIMADKDYLAAFQQRALTKLKQKDFGGAVEDCDKAIALDKNNHTSYFYKGCAADSLNSMQLAEMLYKKAIDLMLDQKSKKEGISPQFQSYYINYGSIQRKLGKTDDALKSYNTAMLLDPNDPTVYYLRGLCYYMKADYQTAITDYSKSIVLNDKNAAPFLERGFANKKLGQFGSAITDFTRAIVLNENDPKAFTGRGACYFETAKYSESLKDLERAAKLTPKDTEIKKLVEETTQKIYEINRETKIPIIVLTAPQNDLKNHVNIPENKDLMVFSGKVKDDSEIKSIDIDGVQAAFKKDELNPTFSANIPVKNKVQIRITATDIYNNASVEIYTVNKTETGLPLVTLLSPLATPELEIYLNSESTNLYFEGEVQDASFINSITVEGLVAGFNPNELNPKFNTNINILNKDTIHVIVSDIYGNTSKYNYFIDRKASAAAASNPMGRTWAVFVDNTNYQNLSSLQGTTADVTKMRAALAGYKIDKTIVKKDMSKSEMEKFFSIELRDMLRDNMINSVLIWRRPRPGRPGRRTRSRRCRSRQHRAGRTRR